MSLEGAEPDAESRELLAHVVVQFARNPRALDLGGGQETTSKVPNLGEALMEEKMPGTRSRRVF